MKKYVGGFSLYSSSNGGHVLWILDGDFLLFPLLNVYTCIWGWRIVHIHTQGTRRKEPNRESWICHASGKTEFLLLVLLEVFILDKKSAGDVSLDPEPKWWDIGVTEYIAFPMNIFNCRSIDQQKSRLHSNTWISTPSYIQTRYHTSFTASSSIPVAIYA